MGAGTFKVVPSVRVAYKRERSSGERGTLCPGRGSAGMGAPFTGTFAYAALRSC